MPPATLRDYLAYLLADAERRMNGELARRFEAEGAPVEHWRILHALADGHGHSMGELASAVLLNHPTLTKTLDRMVSDGLVYRRQDTRDRRRVAVYLSEQGRALLRRLDKRAAEHQAMLIESLGADDAAELMSRLAGLVDVLNC